MPRVAIRSIRGRKRYFERDLAKEVKRKLGERIDREIKPHFIKQFERIVADWDHKPGFRARKYITPDEVRVTVHPVGPNKQIYAWVTKGTAGKGKGRKYPIEAKNAPFLSFQLGYAPHTQPKGALGQKFGGPGVAVGPWRRKKKVWHPGITPREFEKDIAKRNKRWFSRRMENIWRRVIRRL